MREERWKKGSGERLAGGGVGGEGEGNLLPPPFVIPASLCVAKL